MCSKTVTAYMYGWDANAFKDFAKDYLKCAWSAHPDVDPETAALAESEISKDVATSLKYARDILKCPWCEASTVNPEVARKAEENFTIGPEYAVKYAGEVLGCAWSAHPKVDKEVARKAERMITEDKIYIMKYAKDVLKGPWTACPTIDKETAQYAERIIANNWQFNLRYVETILKCPWDKYSGIDQEVVKSAMEVINSHGGLRYWYDTLFTEEEVAKREAKKTGTQLKFHNASYRIAHALGHAWSWYAEMGDDGFAIIDWDSLELAELEDVGHLGQHWFPENESVSGTGRISWKVEFPFDVLQPDAALVTICINRPGSSVGAASGNIVVLHIVFSVDHNGELTKVFRFEKAEDRLIKERHWDALADLLKAAFDADLDERDRFINRSEESE